MPYIEDLGDSNLENQLEWDSNWEQRIWRYLDMEQFLSLMHRSSLRFGRADLFADNFEGTVPSAKALPKDLDTLYRRADEITNISCWHKASAESMMMWEIYSDRGVVIESTPQRLRDSFCDEREFSIQFADVKYLDYTSDSFDFFERTEDGGAKGNMSKPFQFKREYYRGEDEFRAITTSVSSNDSEFTDPDNEGEKFDYNKLVDQHKTPGLFITVDLDELITSVRLSPYSSYRDYQAVKKLADRKHGLGERVRLSNTKTEAIVAKYQRK